ncbi:ATP-binding protein [Nonomuraea guangzhouensis]|uniref:ATP-binding protein n=1 Tax=Nonomuraea guangzhouensis TaxID=1291555 RepID=A0ABW4GZK3_9ACTN|nr:ATP-binding protein [Nonomuraea guangzhouensis]
MSGLFLAEIVLPGVKSSVSVARRCVAEVLIVAGHEDVSDVRLAVSELVTNAVAHTASGEPGGFVTVEVSSLDAVMAYIEVIDDGSAVTVPEVHKADAEECGGRGLWLVEAVAARWGVRDEGYRRRVVWAEMSTKSGTSACAVRR